MVFFKPSIFYYDHKTALKLAYFNCIKHFSIPRFLFTIIFLSLHFAVVFLLIIGRIIDEIFLSGYKKVNIKEPVFIISNPRCGTTFLHRLLSLDKDHYTYTLLYHTLFPCAFYIIIIRTIARLDNKMGGFLKKIIDFADKLFFSGWKDVHPMGFYQPEEDEALFNIAVYSPALVLLSPWAYKLNYLKYLDTTEPKTKEKIKEYYISSLQRIVYATNPDVTLLLKNVYSTGRLNFILDCFPDAKIIYPVRHPYKAIPSVISMFTGPWKAHSRDIKDDSEEARGFGQIMIDYYNYIYQQKSIIDKHNLLILKYNEIVSEPQETAYKIYDYFGFKMSEQYKEALKNYTSKSRNYKSKHSYSLAQYGYTKEYIYSQLHELMDEFELDKDVENV